MEREYGWRYTTVLAQYMTLLDRESPAHLVVPLVVEGVLLEAARGREVDHLPHVDQEGFPDFFRVGTLSREGVFDPGVCPSHVKPGAPAEADLGPIVVCQFVPVDGYETNASLDDGLSRHQRAPQSHVEDAPVVTFTSMEILERCDGETSLNSSTWGRLPDLPSFKGPAG